MPSHPTEFPSRLIAGQSDVKATNTAQAADLAAATWRKIDDALWPIIGHAGMAALFRRSLYLARTDQPALTAMVDVEIAHGDYAPLREVLAQQSSVDAAMAVQAALLKIFLDLLTSLIGAALTERLLRSVGNNPSSGEAVQDT
ncbi:MAG TPA: hypothetical protein VN693_00945 [Rhodanobacteraceae bacterium]|nr:hypothetical protein [Rhodanobacteraceae bacterium]